MDKVATIWMKHNNVNQKTIKAIKRHLKFVKRKSALDYKVKDLISDLEDGTIQNLQGIGAKKIEELNNKLQSDSSK